MLQLGTKVRIKTIEELKRTPSVEYDADGRYFRHGSLAAPFGENVMGNCCGKYYTIQGFHSSTRCYRLVEDIDQFYWHEWMFIVDEYSLIVEEMRSEIYKEGNLC